MERPLPVDGQPPRIEELWAWTVTDPLTDTEGIMAAKMSDGSGMSLVTSVRALAERLRPLAEAAVAQAEEPRPVLRLRRFVAAEPAQEGFTCPRPGCGRTSYNPNDKREGYCGACHDWTGVPA